MRGCNASVGGVARGVPQVCRRSLRRRWIRTARPAFALMVAATFTSGCSTTDRETSLDTRLWTNDLSVRVRLTPRPPYAREETIVKVVVTDKESGAPVENGEGRIYASSRDSVNIFDGLERGPEPGTYYAKLRFLTSGDWAMGLQFRRDSSQALQTMDDPPWYQSVRNAR